MTKINQVKENQREIEYPGNAGSPLLVKHINDEHSVVFLSGKIYSKVALALRHLTAMVMWLFAGIQLYNVHVS